MSAEQGTSANRYTEPDLTENKNILETETPIDNASHLERLGKITTLGVKVTAMMLASGIPAAAVSGYAFDVNVEKARVIDSKPFMIENSPVPDATSQPALPVPEGVYRAMDASDKTYIDGTMRLDRLAIFNGPGFGMAETYEGDESLSAFGEYGANVSINYGYNGINIPATADRMLDYIHENNITEIGLYGDSMGSIVVLQLASELLKIEPHIHIKFIILDAPAVDASVLRPKSRSDAYTLINSFPLPDKEYSRPLRQLAELYLRVDQIMKDPSTFGPINDQVHKEIYDNPDLTSNLTLEDQAQMIFNPKVSEIIHQLGELPKDRQPILAAMGAEHSEMDDVVNMPAAFRFLKKRTDEAKLTLLGPYGLSEYHHGAQYMDKKEYKEMLPVIMSDINTAITRRDSPVQAPNLAAH